MKKSILIGNKAKLLRSLVTCCLALLLSNFGKAQYTCSTAINLGTNLQTDFSTLSNDDVWIGFTGSSGMHAVTVRPEYPAAAFPNPTGDHIDTIQVFKGSICGSLTLMYTYVRPAGQRIRFNFAFISGTHYFLRVSTGCKCNDMYLLSLLTYGPSVCEGSCNLSCNGNFDLTAFSTPINPYCSNIGYSGCWNSLYDNANTAWEDMTDYSDPSAGEYQGTPDYFNTSSTAPPQVWNYNMGVSSNFMGTQPAFSGGAYAGIFTHMNWPQYFGSPLATGNYGRYYREYIQQEMCDSMIAGHKYKVSFSISLADESALSTYIGVLFTLDTIWQPDPPAGNLLAYGMPYTHHTPQFETPTQDTVKSGWVTYTFNYTATANFKHMSIGNFRLPASGNQTQLNSHIWTHHRDATSIDSAQVAYYYIDGVSVIPIDSIQPNQDTLLLCRGGSDTLKAFLGGPNPNVSYAWTATPSDASLTSWLSTHPQPNTYVVIQPNVNTTYYVTVTDTLYHCTYKDTFYVYVGGENLDSIKGHLQKCDTLDRYVVYHHPNLSSTIYTWHTNTGDLIIGNGNDTIHINWLGSLSLDSWLYVNATDTITGCVSKDSVRIKLCCLNPSAVTIYNNSASSIFGTGPQTVAGGNYYINGVFLIDENVHFIGSTLNMGPDAKIQVTGGHTLELEGATVRAGCCEMWDAIEGMGVNDSIIAWKFTYIGDAIRGIVSNNGSPYKVYHNVIFNRNYVSITVNPYHGNHGGIVEQTIFKSVSAAYCPSTSGTLLPPYAGQWPLYGICATSVDSITFGDPASINFQNTFTNLRNGIRTKNTNSKIYNNKFVDVNKSGNSSKAVWCGGRFISFLPFNFTQYQVVVGGNSFSTFQKNYFISCPNGVYTDTAVSTIVFNDKFDYIYSGTVVSLSGVAVTVRHCEGPARLIDVARDSINNYGTGVFCYYNQHCKTRIKYNMITRSVAGYANCTGVIGVSNGANSDTTIIGYNTMRNVKDGVRLTSVNHATITDNLIYLRPTPLSTQPNRGIALLNCHKDAMIRNDIYKENPTVAITTLWVGGIYLGNCDSCKVNCNNVFRMGYGIQCNGPGTVGGTFFSNYMNQDKRGIWLNNGSVLGQQGSSTVASDNRWTGPVVTDRLYASGFTLGNLTNFYYRPIGSAFVPAPSTIQPGSIAIASTVTTLTIPPTKDCDYIQEPQGGGTSQLIAKGQIVFSGNQNSGTWLSRQGLYSILIDDSIYAASDSILTNFKDSADQHNIGVFQRAMVVYSRGTSANSGSMVAAYNHVNNITPSNAIEEHLKVVEHILLRQRINGGDFTQPEIDDLRAIAQLCPFTDGNAVYLARGILFPLDSTEYENACESDDGSGNRFADPYVEQTDSVVFNLYPNPNNGEVTIEYSLQESETGMMSVYATTGQLVRTIYLIPGINKMTVSFVGLETGLYLYDVKVNGELKKADRIVIIR